MLEGAASEEPGTGTRRLKAAKAYGVSRAVLDAIGRLSSEHGRKTDGKGNPLQPDERRFLEKATETIIRRMAEKADDPSKALPQMTLADFQT